jgi:hypothetical protein
MLSGAIPRPGSRHPRAARAALISITSAVIMMLAFMVIPAGGSTAGLKGKLVALIVDRVGVADFPTADTPFCLGLARRRSFGMMVTRTGERENGKELDLGADYVTLGAGVRARGAGDAELSFNSSERPAGFGGTRTAGELYRGFTGGSAPPDGVVCLGFTQVLNKNKGAGTGENVGLMGRLLREAGLEAAVAGNGDSLQKVVRLAPLVCCEEKGVVPLGDVSDGTTVFAPESPGGYRTDYARLLDESRRLLAASDLLVVDTGETGRIDRESGNMDPDLLARERAAALKRVDRFAREMTSMLDLDSSLLLVVSPGAPMEAREEGNYLTPFIAAGNGFGRGLLTSQSARRPGLVNNVDFLPTAIGYFGLAVPSGVVGSAMNTVKGPADQVGYLKDVNAQFGVTRRARWPVVVTYLALVFLTMCMAALCLPAVSRRLGWPRDLGRAARSTSVAAVVLLAGPLSFLVVSAFRYGGYTFPAVFCAAFTLVVGLGAWLLQRGRPRMDPVVALCLLTASVMVVDLFMGGRLVMIPLLGGSALEGMRLYGLTNTLVGLLLATSLWGIAGLWGSRALERGAARWLLLLALLGLSFVVGFGALGANVGGFIAAIATCLTFFVATSKRGFTGWRTAGIALATAAGTGVMILLDSLLTRTHAGKLVSGGGGGFVSLVQRKLVIQFGQISFLLLPALVLVAAVVAMALWLRRPGSFWRRRWEGEKLQTATLFSLVVGSLVALVFNDTGVAMLGMMTVITVLAMSYYLLRENGR